MNDDKLLEKIKQSAESCEIPEGVEPAKMKERIGGGKHMGKRKWVYRVGGVAAAVLVVVIAAVAIPALRGSEIKSSEDKATSTQMVQDAGDEEVSSERSKVDGGVEEVKELADVFIPAEKYEDVFKAMQEKDETFSMERETTDSAMNESASDSSSMKSEAAVADVSAGSGVDSGYSTTNLQVEGVDEGDIVKTDGDYLYIIHENRSVRIVKIDGKDMSETARVDLEAGNNEELVQEIYLSGKILNVVTQGYGTGLEQKDADTYYMDYRAFTKVYTYDLSKPEKPKLMGKVTQDGYYNTSRKVDGHLYLFTSFYPERVMPVDEMLREGTKREIIPSVNNEMIAPTDIYLPVHPRTSGYMVIASIDMEKPGGIVDKKAVLQDASQFYITKENIYVQCQNWNYTGDNTSIAKFHFEKGMITGESAALVPGTITDTFAINEHGGHLRVLTTAWDNPNGDEQNHVTVLDSKMNIVGRIGGLAKGETIYSARFMGDIGYFVTYRNVDPLFSVDFSNPAEPKILGELKVTGFSEYLHFYGENRLLGIGWETDPNTSERKGLKLSMFDIADPTDVKEVSKTVVKNIDSFPGEYDYKALTVDPVKNVIGLATTTWGPQDTGYSYMVFSYNEEKGFENHLAYTFATEDYIRWSYENSRGVYVDDTFYLVAHGNIVAFDMKDGYKKLGEFAK